MKGQALALGSRAAAAGLPAPSSTSRARLTKRWLPHTWCFCISALSRAATHLPAHSEGLLADAGGDNYAVRITRNAQAYQ